MRAGSTLLGVFLGAFLVLEACSDPPPKTAHNGSGEVPANSLSDAKLRTEDAGAEESTDPTQPLTTKIGEAPLDPSTLSAPAASSSSSGKPGKPAPAGTGAVTKAECDKVMDKYISLEIASNPALKGVGQDVIDQAKQMMRQQNGEAPCTATRAQYKCAMATSTTAAWQKCMK